MSNSFATESSWRSFGGTMSVHTHRSTSCRCDMKFAVYVPPQAADGSCPVLWYLSGLTCTWANVMEKSGIARAAAAQGFVIVAPDTSPRGDDVADDDAYDLGQGAGFYLTATEAPWADHYRMDRYITEELAGLVADGFPIDTGRQGITGHSMGGHGALTLHLKHPDTYRSVSAFSPIAAPCDVPWGQKAFTHYLGEDRAAWSNYDASRLVVSQPSRATMLIDTGTVDPFLDEQLSAGHFQAVCHQAGQPLEYRMQQGYDHSYWFIASFIGDHLAHHAAALQA